MDSKERVRYRCALIMALAGASTGLAPAGPAQDPGRDDRISPTTSSTTSWCYVTSAADSILGDCDLDGDVDDDDVDILVANFVKTFNFGDVLTPRQGDVNWDGKLDLNDIDVVTTNHGNSIPTLPLIEGVDLDTTLSSGSLEIVDNDLGSSGEVIKESTTIYRTDPADYYEVTTTEFPDGRDSDSDGIVDPLVESDGGVTITLENETDDGFDLKVVLTNNDSLDKQRSVGGFWFDEFHFDTTATTGSYYNISTGGKLVTGNGKTDDGWANKWNYPGVLYSPAQILSVAGYTVGLSVQYPILEYEHDMEFSARRLSGTGEWRIVVWPSRDGKALVLDADETLEYTISVRIHKASSCDTVNDWMRTIRPYRRYFRALYGPVQYTRDAEPVSAHNIALKKDVDANSPWDGLGPNPWGFVSSAYRIDTHGWYEYCQSDTAPYGPFYQENQDGWERSMLWAPSGSYDPDTADGVSFPPQFTSEWDSYLSTSNVYDYDPLQGIGNAMDLGLYWGHSDSYADTWNDDDFDDIDIFNTTHTDFAYDELDGAEYVNASLIGMDSFGMPVWESYWWLRRLKEDYPDFTFIVEPHYCDLIHTLVPMMNVGTNDPDVQGGDYWRYDDGVPLMDFLLPGHEFWATVERRWVTKHLTGSDNGAVTEAQIEGELQEYADLGLVICYFGSTKYDRTNGGDTYEAAQTWTTTVPSDLR